MSFTEPRFYFFGEDSFEHKHTGETVCESDLVVPHKLPIFDKFYIRTWSFQELPSDFKVESKGCKKFQNQTINDDGIPELDLPKSFMHYTFFRPDFQQKEGFVSITAYGKETKISWVKQGDHLLVTDFEGYQAKMYPFKLEEIISKQDKDLECQKRAEIWESTRHLFLRSKLIKSMDLPNI
tara:strand:- start:477 stop:1019 length:543 start_codon:yes stop_codon:yes gene_type:complete